LGILGEGLLEAVKKKDWTFSAPWVTSEFVTIDNFVGHRVHAL
jgi:hypothetical protein